MNIAPGEITSQAYTDQVRLHNAIKSELIGIASIRGPCEQNPSPLNLPQNK
jgi:hypothetical protein